MKFFELETKRETAPIVYIDMDGVLADFFGEVAREHGVNYWREIHRQEIAIEQTAKKPGFFLNLPPMPNAASFIRGVKHLASKFSILSSPLQSNVEQSSQEKSQWLQNHMKNIQPQSVIFDHEKFKFAKQANGTPNILIDDFDTNINLWISNGGIGILHVDKEYQQSLQQLKKALHGDLEQEVRLAVKEESDEIASNLQKNKLYTARQVLKYVQGIHKDYHLPKPILKYKTWVLIDVSVDSLKTPEFVHQDDPYRRVIDIDWDHVQEIPRWDILNRPVVIDDNGWVLDGNHRATAARAAGIDVIPALAPYQD